MLLFKSNKNALRLPGITKLLLVVIVLAITVSSAQAQDSTTTELPQTGIPIPELQVFDKVILSIMREHQIPGASLAIVHQGRLVLAHGYGYADTTADIPVRPYHRFRIASVTKPITSAAILNLVEQGKLQLDDKVLELLRDIQPPQGVQVDSHWYDITVRDLLYHAGGFDRQESFDPMFFSTRIPVTLGERPPLTARMAIRYMLGRPLDLSRVHVKLTQISVTLSWGGS